ncbi:MAG: UvrD-helicase domain-containing protein [Candidatus Krumholzibacteria bacterium]|nr:UvrD-helicase domain-containing protein [Candidatus Krumholzibacteria bacterium]
MSDFELNSEQVPPVMEHDRHLILSAGAGSGKTRVLVERVLQILRDSHWDLSMVPRILAITFTEKATLAMRRKILSKVEEERAKCDPKEAATLLALAREMENASISTIHSFCSRILRENALEAGLDPRFRILDDLELYEIREEILELLLKSQNPDLLLLAGEFGVSAVLRALEEVRELRRSLNLPPELLDEKSSRELLKDLKSEVIEALRVALLDKLQQLLNDFRGLCSHFPGEKHPTEKGDERIIASISMLEDMDPDALDPGTLKEVLLRMKGLPQGGKAVEDGDVLKKKWKKLKDEIENLQATAERLSTGDPTEIPGAPKDLTLAFFRLLGHYSREVHREMRSRGCLDQEDLQIEAVRLLEEHPPVLQRYRRLYRHVLIDEFQDTNSLQLRLARLLVPEDADPKKNTLFLVGDHRQSIYAFRNADVGVFFREREKMAARKQARDLRFNYRSHPRLMDFFNQFFPVKEFPPLKSQKPGGKDLRVLLQIRGREKSETLLDCRRDTARAIADTIWKAREEGLAIQNEDGSSRPLEWKDVAILLRSGTDLPVLTRALAERGIPHEAAGGREFFLREELEDLENLVSALDDPLHRFKLFRALRGNLIGMSTADLLCLFPQVPRRLKTQRLSAEFLDGLRDPKNQGKLSDEGVLRLHLFLSLLDRFSGRLHRIPVSRLLSELVEATAYDLRSAGDRFALKILRNLRQVSEIFQEMENSRRMTVRDYLDHMIRARDLNPRQEEAWVPEEGESLLRIFTIHSAKGLEFPFVVLADLDRDVTSVQKEGEISSLRMDLPDGRQESLVGLAWKDMEELKVTNLCHAWIKLERKRREGEEMLRLFYVALTRAKDYLLMSGIAATPDLRVDFPLPVLNPTKSFLDMLMSRLPGIEQKLYRLNIVGQDEIPSLGEGVKAGPEKEKEAPRKTHWPHLLPPELPPSRVEMPVTGLTLLRSCPLRWLLERRLGLRGLSEALFESYEERSERSAASGASFGSLLHGILENWDYRLPAEEAFEKATPGDLEGELREEARRILSSLEESKPMDFGVGPLSAARLRREESFLLDLGELVLTGQTDLVAEGEGRRVLIDWKSDRVEGEALKERASHYELQMQLYALALAESGQKADEAFLVFLRSQEKHRIDISDAALETARMAALDIARDARAIGGDVARVDLSLDSLSSPRNPPCKFCAWREGPCTPGYRDSD